MIHLPEFLSPDLLRPLGLTLLHFIWQGACAGSARSAGYGADQERVGSLRIGNCGFTRNGGGTNRHVHRVAAEFLREHGSPPAAEPTGSHPHRKLVRPT